MRAASWQVTSSDCELGCSRQDIRQAVATYIGLHSSNILYTHDEWYAKHHSAMLLDHRPYAIDTMCIFILCLALAYSGKLNHCPSRLSALAATCYHPSHVTLCDWSKVCESSLFHQRHPASAGFNFDGQHLSDPRVEPSSDIERPSISRLILESEDCH